MYNKLYSSHALANVHACTYLLAKLLHAAISIYTAQKVLAVVHVQYTRARGSSARSSDNMLIDAPVSDADIGV